MPSQHNHLKKTHQTDTYATGYLINIEVGNSKDINNFGMIKIIINIHQRILMLSKVSQTEEKQMSHDFTYM